MAIGRVPGATGIQPSIVDAKGDLIAATAADSVSRLAVGSDGQYLKADSTAGTGLAWATLPSSGKVLQVVSGTYATRVDVASTTFTDTGLSLSITPTSASSKVLVIISQHTWVYRATNEAGGRVKLLRGATDIYNQSATLQTMQLLAVGATQSELASFMPIIYLDSPATTSSTTYKTQGKAESTANSGEISFQKGSNVSTITLMEIGA